jgi:hypothetical protein
MLPPDTDLVYINRNNGELIVFMVEHQSTIAHYHTLVRRVACVGARVVAEGVLCLSRVFESRIMLSLWLKSMRVAL